MTPRSILFAAAVVLGFTAPGEAAAPHHAWPAEGGAGPASDPPEGFQPLLSAAAGTLCVKQCPNDDLPCDPPAYKVADGRCTALSR